ncbi:MAG: 2-hydroxyglutaryl-CoA dehydratase [Clostridiales bacterium GWB2_37_7]|nr:MAG: 2-hydroxyglutaryl-CoA dehydratase [Clostridiales bacterium GWB2_37_7]
MKVGIPKGLLYYEYQPFFQTFFEELGAELIVSPDTNKDILDKGVKYCVDEACLPVKVFHGHVSAIKDKCDLLLIPRIMQQRQREFICPKFCGLPEMVVNSIPDMPKATMTPFYATSKEKLFDWAKITGQEITHNKARLQKAFEAAMEHQSKHKTGFDDKGSDLRVALAGHPYNIYDNYLNMNLVKKLKKLGVGVITEEHIDEDIKIKEASKLYKRPFWSFATNNYGFTSHIANNGIANGIIYISSFACGIDSVVIELIKHNIGDFPFLILKIDEHTGEAGIDTRIEAFVDMLERRSC